MKKLFFLFAIAIVVVMSSCNKMQDAEEIGTLYEPSEERAHLVNTLNEAVKSGNISEMSPSQIDSLVHAVAPGAERIIYRDLVGVNLIQEGDSISIQYLYFDGEGKCEMQDSAGVYQDVKFRDTWAFQVKFPDDAKQIFKLYCFNGMNSIKGDMVYTPAHEFTSITRRFAITDGQGTAYHMGYNVDVINMAELFGLYLYKGTRQKEKYRIKDYDRARSLIGRSKITVKDKTGWVFTEAGEGNWFITIPGKYHMLPAKEFCRIHNPTHYAKFYE